MADPRVPQGVLNRLRGSAVFNDHPELNITAAFLGREGVKLAFQGQSTTFIDNMTGLTTSPEPYQHVIFTAELIKTQSLAAQFEAQRVRNSQIGDFVFTADASALPKYQILNGAIQNVGEINANGSDAGYRITIEGYYLINSSLWDL